MAQNFFSSSNQPSIRCNSPSQQGQSTPRTATSFTADFQPSTQQAVQLSLVTQHEQLPLDQASATSPRQASATSFRTAGVTSLRPASASSLLLQQTHTVNSVVTQPPPAFRQPLAKTEGGRPFATTPPPFYRYDMAQGFLEGVLISTRQSIIILLVGTLGQRGGRD